eukprot:gene2464-10679_t
MFEAGSVGVVGGALSASAPAAAQAGRLIILTQGCREGSRGEGHLPFLFHPTGVSLGGSALPTYAGCVVVNCVLVAAAFLLARVCALAVRIAMRRDMYTDAAEGLLRVPTAPTVAWVILSQGPTFAGAKLLLHGGGAEGVLLGTLGICGGAALVLVVLRSGQLSQRECVYKLDPAAVGPGHRCTRVWLGPGEWLSLRPQKGPREKRVERWSVSFRSALPALDPDRLDLRSTVLSLDLFLTQLALVSAGVGGGSCEACGAMRIVDGVIASAFVCVVVAKRPYSRQLRLPCTVASQTMLALASFILAADYFGPCSDAPPPVVGVLLALSGVGLLLSGFLDLTAMLQTMRTQAPAL